MRGRFSNDGVVLRPSGRSGLRIAAGDPLHGGASMNVQPFSGRAGAVLSPAAVCRNGARGRKCPHVLLERFAIICRQLAQRTDTRTCRATEPLLLNRAGTRDELNNGLPAMWAGQGDLIHFHADLGCDGADDYSQQTTPCSARINCSHSWQIRLIFPIHALLSIKVPA